MFAFHLNQMCSFFALSCLFSLLNWEAFSLINLACSVSSTKGSMIVLGKLSLEARWGVNAD